MGKHVDPTDFVEGKKNRKGGRKPIEKTPEYLDNLKIKRRAKQRKYY